MSVILAPLSLAELDRLERDLIVLAPFSDERPLAGLAGAVDWRLNGRLSRMVLSGYAKAGSRERILTNAAGRLGVERLLLYGLGPSRSFDTSAFARHVTAMLDVARDMGSRSLAMTIPGSDLLDDDLPERLAILYQALVKRYQGQATLLVHKRHNFKELQAGFAAIRKEFDAPASKRGAHA